MNIKSKALLAYVVIFLVGGASGFFLNEAIRPQFPDKSFDQGGRWNSSFSGPRGERGGERMQQRMENFLARELDLEEDQREPFFNILGDHLEKLHGEIRQYKSEEIVLVRDLYSQFLDDVDEILTEEQLRELNRIAHPDSVQHRRMQRRRQGQPK